MRKVSAVRQVFIFSVLIAMFMMGTSTVMPLTPSLPFQLQARATTLKIDTGFMHTCGIHFDNLVRCWGNNLYGQSTVPADLGIVNAINTGYAHTCAVKTDDTVRCWGWNFYGQSTVPADLGIVTAVGGGDGHTCAIKTDNTLRCWGWNAFGQSTVPVDLGTVSAISVGSAHTCAIKTDNTLRCWGYNNYGQSTVPADLGTVSAISAGGFHVCAIKTDNAVRCWGSNSDGQITVPADLGTVSAISLGHAHTCAVKFDNTVHCWGDNDDGQNTPPAPLVTLDLSGSPMAETGGVATVTVTLSDYAWTDVVVNLAYSGTASGGGIDYQASASSVSFTTSDLTGSESLTGVGDSLFEGDETIIVDIDTLTGGIEDSVQQGIAVIQDDDLPPSGELIDNGGFESDLTPWVVKKGTKDKLKCDQPDKPVAHSGTCAFMFKGGVGENSSLQQILDLTGTTFATGDTLDLSVYLNAKNAAASGKVKVAVRYVDTTSVGKIKLALTSTTGYTVLNGSYTLIYDAVSKIKVQIKHISPAGKVYLDDVSLIHTSVGAAASVSPRLPLP